MPHSFPNSDDIESASVTFNIQTPVLLFLHDSQIPLTSDLYRLFTFHAYYEFLTFLHSNLSGLQRLRHCSIRRSESEINEIDSPDGKYSGQYSSTKCQQLYPLESAKSVY